MKTHEIDGKTYVEVERKAEVGEKVLTVIYRDRDDSGIKQGDILTCESRDYEDGSITVKNGTGFFDISIGDKYHVLEPVASEEWPLLTEAQPPLELTANDIRWQPDKVIDLLANLARRVSSLERHVDSLSTQLKDTQGNVERQGVEIAELRHLAESNEEDVRQLDERTQVVNEIQKYYGGAR